MAATYRKTKVEKFAEQTRTLIKQYDTNIQLVEQVQGKGNEVSNQLMMQRNITHNLLMDFYKHFDLPVPSEVTVNGQA